ncbi:50S ribosomal protein L23 [Candidatus Karelsulcia muelleri]|uniref:50S ribosomal protein L23 n=1 Tax=Candidatus Karelsulcia muelleri TaxID=336810 RepID=UPI000D7C2BAF|nr:50S ribosomal protein L23 [Candidatus Karelsulcia muelleri]
MLINITKKFSNKKLDPFFTFKVPLFYNKKEIKKLIYKIYNINFKNIKTMIYCKRTLKKSKKGVLKINKFKKVILKLKQDYKLKIFNKLKIKANLDKLKIFKKLKINYNLDKLKILKKLKNFSYLELLKIFNKLKKYFNYFNLGILKNFNKFKNCSQLERLKIFNQLKKSFNLSNIKETKLN